MFVLSWPSQKPAGFLTLDETWLHQLYYDSETKKHDLDDLEESSSTTSEIFKAVPSADKIMGSLFWDKGWRWLNTPAMEPREIWHVCRTNQRVAWRNTRKTRGKLARLFCVIKITLSAQVQGSGGILVTFIIQNSMLLSISKIERMYKRPEIWQWLHEFRRQTLV